MRSDPDKLNNELLSMITRIYNKMHSISINDDEILTEILTENTGNAGKKQSELT